MDDQPGPSLEFLVLPEMERTALLALRLEAEKNAAGRLWRPLMTLNEIPAPMPGVGECSVRVAYCGICGSDYSMASADSQGLMTYSGLCEPPVTIGHEFSGWVEYSETFAHGSPVVAEETYGCQKCKGCASGGEQNCQHPFKIGFNRDGAFAPTVIVPERKCWSISAILARYGNDTGMQLAALVQPYAIAFSCFHSSVLPEFQPGETLLVNGAGPVGLCAIDLGRALGAAEVHVVEPWLERRVLARKLGASKVYASRDELPLRFSADWMLDSSGTPELLRIAEGNLKRRGKLVLLSKSTNAPSPLSFIESTFQVMAPDGHSCPDSYPQIISLMATGALRGDPMISGLVNLQGALARLKAGLKSPGKILVNPQGM